MAAHELPECLRANTTMRIDDEWRCLSTQYNFIRDAINGLGGALGNEEEAEALWSDLEVVFDRIAVLRARSLRDVVQKVRAALEMLDETPDDLVRDLLTSAMNDLVAQGADEKDS